ncbi:MAG: hypothetical protein AUJ12_06915 [Alphaproteobacteria bacterium CG1_02_46_17]|nr:MAG: hypothetical protein AUJ12_06915 [Alphaproteobacteria bacterium CG1_02_46_17]
MSLQNFEKAREAMVVSQLQPSGVVDEKVNCAYLSIPREMFVSEALRGVSYLDDDLPVGEGRFLLEPLILAKMVQDANLEKTSKVLDVAGGTGYSAAILSQLVGEVYALDPSDKLLHAARLNWEHLGLTNISAVLGRAQDGYVKAAKYDAIFINGAVAEPPKELIGQLAPHGKLYCVLVKDGDTTGEITRYSVSDSGSLLQFALGDAATAYVPGLMPQGKFEFQK